MIARYLVRMRTACLPAMLCLPALAAAAPGPRIPRDAPYCALPNERPVFVSPMGEPFRGARGEAWPSARWFAGADRNGDGAVDRAEFAADADRFFRLLDVDKDGRLEPEEVDRYEREIAPEIALYQDRRSVMPQGRRHLSAGESGYDGPLGAGRYAWLNVPEPVAAADADVNRVIDRDEFRAAASRRFDQLGAGAPLRLATLPHTPQQAEIDGPCRPRPKPKRSGHDDRTGEAREARGDDR